MAGHPGLGRPWPRGLLPRPGGRAARALALAVTGVVAGLLLMPNAELPIVAPDLTDLVLHVLVMGSVGFAHVLGWPRALAAVGLVLAMLAIGLETAQIWVPGRYFTWADMVANLIGAGAGGWIALRVTRA